MPNRWLIKTDPRRTTFDAMRARPTTTWRDVTQPHALIHLRRMRRGDDVLVYHMGAARAIVGLARVRRGPRPDPLRDDPALVAVVLAAGAPLARPVGIAALRGVPGLSTWALLRVPRLSVMPVPANAWRAVLRLARTG